MMTFLYYFIFLNSRIFPDNIFLGTDLIQCPIYIIINRKNQPKLAALSTNNGRFPGTVKKDSQYQLIGVLYVDLKIIRSS